MIASRIFDNGIICSGTQSVIAPAGIYDAVIAEFIRQGAFYTDDPALDAAFRDKLYPGGAFNKDAVGKTAAEAARIAGVAVPDGTGLIIVKPEGYDAGDPLHKEKLCPLMTAYKAESWEGAVELARRNLAVEGAGHSADVQSENRAHIEYAADALPVSRILVNQICATMNGGSFANGLSPTTTLGCGSWGGNSISENLTYYHLINKSRVAYVKKEWRQPDDAEIWA
jgi:succinate-semialdehyde dehydrogenase